MPYPKSFLKLLLIGFSLVVLPFLLAFANASHNLKNITKQSRVAVTQAVQMTSETRTLIEQLSHMERATRQYLVIGSSELLDRFNLNHKAFDDTVAKLRQLPLDAQQQTLLFDLESRVDMLAKQVSQGDAAKTMRLLPEFGRMFDAANTLLVTDNQVIERETSALQAAAEEAQNALMWQGLSLIPFALFVTFTITYLIARPLRQIDSAIHDLGNGKLSGKIEVNGPEDLKKLGERLDWLREQQAHLEDQKSRFLREVSHELKTPLTAIREGTELLTEGVGGPLSQQQQEIATILRENSLKLQRLIEGLLNFSASRFHADTPRTQVALHEVVKRVLEDHALPLSTRQLRLISDIENTWLWGDETRLKTLCDNLVSNAAKFAPQRGILKISLHGRDDLAILEVMDNGPGVSEKDRPFLFEPFYQGSARQEGHVKGTGLGLSIAKDCVLAHGGTIEIVHNPDWKGAHFRIALPLAKGSTRLAA